MGTVPSPNIVAAVDAGQGAFNNRFAEYMRAAQLQQQMGIEKQQAQQQAEAFPLEQQQRQQAVEQAKVQTQAMQQQQAEQAALRELAPKYVTRDENGKVTGYDYDQFFNDAQGKVSPTTLQKLQQDHVTTLKNYADLDKDSREKEASTNKWLFDSIESLKGIADQGQRQAQYQKIVQDAQRRKMDVGGFPTQAPTNDELTALEAPLGMHAELLKNLETTAKTNKENRGPEPAAAIQEYQFAVSQGYKGTFDQWKKENARAGAANQMASDDVKAIADAIENGDQPPTLQGLYRNGAAVRAELAKRGVPIAKMESDWKATQRYLSTLNGPQQTRLRQAITTATDSLDKIEDLYAEWNKLAPTTGFKAWNRATLKAAMQLPGRPGAVATALNAQIADLTSELGNAYMGGNSPTDHSLELASKNLSADWNEETFKEALKQARANLEIRTNSITHANPAGVSANSPYLPNQNNNQSAETKIFQGHTYVKQQDGSWKLQQ